MRKILLMIAAALTMVACSSNNTTTDKDMNTITFHPLQADYMSVIACHAARGDQSSLSVAIAAGLGAGISENQIKEALSQLYAYCGFPRSLNAMGTLQEVTKMFQENNVDYIIGDKASPLPAGYDALEQGTEVQTKVSGRAFNYEYCPAEDYYLKAHLFGDIFARDVLTHAERELVTVSALSGMENVMPQLQAHVRGALNMGVTEEQLNNICETFFLHGLMPEGLRLKAAIASVNGNPQVVSPSAWPLGEPNDAFAQYFIGQSYLAVMDPESGLCNVTFEPCCRNNWHIHHAAVQHLVCVSGRGWYQEWGKDPVELKPGTVVTVPAGTKHWHGAARDSWMQHLAYYTDQKATYRTEWLEPVTDEQYNKL